MKGADRIFYDVLEQHALPLPVREHRFAPPRRWRFDFAWPSLKVAIEVQGGIWTQGRHTQGAALLKEWEKLNTAALAGWRVLFVQPVDLPRATTIYMLKQIFKLNESISPIEAVHLSDQRGHGRTIADGAGEAGPDLPGVY
jgi:hypothetical protein